MLRGRRRRIDAVASDDEVDNGFCRHAKCRGRASSAPCPVDADVVLWTIAVDPEDVEVVVVELVLVVL